MKILSDVKIEQIFLCTGDVYVEVPGADSTCIYGDPMCPKVQAWALVKSSDNSQTMEPLVLYTKTLALARMLFNDFELIERK